VRIALGTNTRLVSHIDSNVCEPNILSLHTIYFTERSAGTKQEKQTWNASCV